MLALQIAAALAVIGAGISALVWKEPSADPGPLPYAWLAIADGAIGLAVISRRAFQPAEMLVIDRQGITWWKANRTIRWAEIERITLDAYRSTLYLHVKLNEASNHVDAAGPHPIELLAASSPAATSTFG